MRNLVALLILTPCLLTAQGRDFVRENYSKFEYRIPMRDGVKLFTSVYVPKDAITDRKTYPIMLQRISTAPPSGLRNSSRAKSSSSSIRTSAAAT
jgi:predicted acyl esterase